MLSIVTVATGLVLGVSLRSCQGDVNAVPKFNVGDCLKEQDREFPPIRLVKIVEVGKKSYKLMWYKNYGSIEGREFEFSIRSAENIYEKVECSK